MKEDNYLSKLTNKSITQILLNKENILPLEELINKELHNVEILRKLKSENKIYYGEKLSKHELLEILPNIKSEIDTFLEISDVDTPNIGYDHFLKDPATLLLYSIGISSSLLGIIYNQPVLTFGGASLLLTGKALHTFRFGGYRAYYTPGMITLKKYEKRSGIIPITGHEYAHCVQYKKFGVSYDDYSTDFSCLMEGHARGVQRYVSNLYMKKENDNSFLCDITSYTLYELRSSYFWICKELGLDYKKSLVPDDCLSFRSKISKPTCYCLGNTFFSLHESTKGERVYSDVIHKRFKPELK